MTIPAAATHPDARLVELPAPLELTALGGVHRPFPATYTVTGVRVRHDGSLEALAFDSVGRAVRGRRLKAALAREAVRVLGLQRCISLRPRPPRRRLSDLIPEVWGLRLRGVGTRRAG
ncbi:MAG: hypothetical protein D6731_14295 [Planctomycetota bacterium]|nr:MAG: hypothetical protein D6731_14295 [Planctomycetota bacterium]